MPKFSIITTTYKHERFITETIESVLAQSFVDWELLIGDDSPDDITWTIIQQYTQRYPEKIRAWHHTPNKGIVENMNYLISQVDPSSEYITFLEGDDRYVPDALSEKESVFQKYQQVGLIYSDMDFIDGEGNITLSGLLRSQGTRLFHNENIPTEDYILARNPLVVSYSSIAIRKHILMEFFPIRNLTGSKTYAVSDYDLIFQISREHKVYGVEKSLTQYRRHANNLSASYVGLFDDLTLLINKYHADGQISRLIYQQKQTWISLLKAISSLSQGEKLSAYLSLKESLATRPFSYIIYKVAIAILLFLPASFVQKVLQKRIRRGS